MHLSVFLKYVITFSVIISYGIYKIDWEEYRNMIYKETKLKFKTRIKERETLLKIKNNELLYEKHLNNLNHLNKNLIRKSNHAQKLKEELKKYTK